MDTVKSSRKSKMKKRPEEWVQLKTEVARELGLWDQVQEGGWSNLSAEDSGRLGGVFSARKKQLWGGEDAPSAEEVVNAENFPPPAGN